MSIELQKELFRKMQENEEATRKELFQKLQEVLNDINACGFVLTRDGEDRTDKLVDAGYHFDIRTEIEYAAWMTGQ